MNSSLNKSQSRILFISRKYPPSTGGMQEANYQLSQGLKDLTPTEIVSYGGSQKWLFLVYPYLLIRSILRIASFKPTVILLGDGLLAPLGWLIKILFNLRIVVIVHGLDITCNLPFYQQVIPFFIQKLDKLIAVSSYTKEQCIKRGVNQSKITVIPNGVELDKYKTNKDINELKAFLESNYQLDLKDKKILLTVGRLVKRKGHFWFIKEVMPNLVADHIYLIAGDGPEKARIEQTIAENKLKEKVKILGKVSEKTKKYLLHVSDLFIMPNIKVKGDAEGFGIVALEAASVGLPVIASDIEGIRDAVKNNESGFFVNEGNAREFVEKILENKENLEPAKFVYHFSWTVVSKSYFENICCLVETA